MLCLDTIRCLIGGYVRIFRYLCAFLAGLINTGKFNAFFGSALDILTAVNKEPLIMNTYLVLAFSAPDSEPHDGGSMEDWDTWMKENGDSVADMGSPLTNGVEGSGKEGYKKLKDDQWPAQGYMMINADSMEAVQEIMKSCPLGDSTPLRIFEKVAMPDTQ